MKYNNTVNANNVNKSGNIANGPRPNARKPKTKSSKGLEARALRSKTVENMINPIVNSDRVFTYMLMYVTNKIIKSVKLTVETAV